MLLTCPNRGVFMLHIWVPYFCKNHVNSRSKTNIFASNCIQCKTKSVWFDEKHAKFYGKTYKFFNFLAPYCRESKIQHPTCRVVGIPKYAPAAYWKLLSDDWGRFEFIMVSSPTPHWRVTPHHRPKTLREVIKPALLIKQLLNFVFFREISQIRTLFSRDLPSVQLARLEFMKEFNRFFL